MAHAAKENPAAQGPLTGKVAVVTGGNRGIGRAIVAGLAQAGATVVLGSRDPEAGKKAAEELAGAGGTIEVGVVDVADQASVTAFSAGVAQRHPRIDTLVSNAGVLLGEDEKASTLDLGLLAKTLDVNGAIRMSAAFARIWAGADASS